MVGSLGKFCVEDYSDPLRFRLVLQSASMEQCEDFVERIRLHYPERAYRILRVGRFGEVVHSYEPVPRAESVSASQFEPVPRH